MSFFLVLNCSDFCDFLYFLNIFRTPDLKILWQYLLRVKLSKWDFSITMRKFTRVHLFCRSLQRRWFNLFVDSEQWQEPKHERHATPHHATNACMALSGQRSPDVACPRNLPRAHLVCSHIALIATRWAWESCLWRRVGVPSEMRALDRALRVSTAIQRAATTTVTLRNLPTSILNTVSQEGWKRRGKLPHKCTIWSSKLHDLPERVRVIWSSAKTRMSNRGAWSANTADQHWFDFNFYIGGHF